MFCKFCGNKIDDDSVFCSKCGKKQDDANVLSTSAPAPIISVATPEEERAGMSIYLNDVRNLEFIANQLQVKINYLKEEANNLRAGFYKSYYQNRNNNFFRIHHIHI